VVLVAKDLAMQTPRTFMLVVLICVALVPRLSVTLITPAVLMFAVTPDTANA
jgi:hypothetical protein